MEIVSSRLDRELSNVHVRRQQNRGWKPVKEAKAVKMLLRIRNQMLLENVYLSIVL